MSQPSQPSGPKRGHAHRRSAALSLSQSELSSIKNSFDPVLKSGSAPTTPAEPSTHGQFVPALDRARSQPALPTIKSEGEAGISSPKTESLATQSRPKVVEFSDRVEYIPRPPSFASSTESESVDVQSGPASLSEAPMQSIYREVGDPSSFEVPEGQLPFESHMHGTRTPSGWWVLPHGRFRELPDDLPMLPTARNTTGSRPVPGSEPDESVSDGMKALKARDSWELLHTSDVSSKGADVGIKGGVRHQAQQEPLLKTQGTKNQPKGKGSSWSGALPRKARSVELPASGGLKGSSSISSKGTGVSQTNLADFALENFDLDHDSTLVIRSPDFEAPRSAPVQRNKEWLSGSDSDSDPETGPQLDLDAVWDRAGDEMASRHGASGGFRSGKRMHSNAAAHGAQSSGVQVHRRAESAPAMAPVDRRYGFPRFGSDPQMADVFEEDEDEEGQKTHAGSANLSKTGKATSDQEAAGLSINSPTANAPHLILPRLHDEDVSAEGLATRGEAEATITCPDNSLDAATEPEADLGIEIVSATDEPRFSVATKSSEGSTITPTPSNDTPRNRPVPASLEFAPPRVYSASVANSTSLNPSPSPATTSFDVPRLGTAHSTATERSGWSSTKTDEVGYSTEDVPSLTDTASTTVSHAVPITPVVATRLDSERSQSVSGPTAERPRSAASNIKRRSLAGLSMLGLRPSSSKSKLSIETKPGEDDNERTERVKKRHRWSRPIMNFFNKSKEDFKKDSQNSKDEGTIKGK